jgi:hypothetical protein
MSLSGDGTGYIVTAIVQEAMSDSTQRKLDQVDTSSTARIDRRQTVLAQIEAALLADKLAVMDLSDENTGTDPYNSGVYPRVQAWGKRPR